MTGPSKETLFIYEILPWISFHMYVRYGNFVANESGPK